MNSLAAFLTTSGTASSGSAGAGTGITMTIIYFVVIIGVFYFILIRPQKKQQKQHDALVAGVEAGDSVVTTSGFYGVVIDVMDDVVIVEFGNNKNCRIPMKKEAIVDIEKPEDARRAAEEASKAAAEAAQAQLDGKKTSLKK